MSAPLVSALMAVFNRERFLAEAIRSVLAQDFGDFELIVVDDGSTDGSADCAARFAKDDSRVILIRQPNAGVANARNTALSRARGLYTAIADSDDISLPSRFRRQVEYLERHPEMVGVGTRYFYIDAQGNKTGPRRYVHSPGMEPMALPTAPDELRAKLLEKGVLYLLHPTVMFRTGALREIGGYREFFRVAEDSDLHLRLLTGGGELANLPELQVLYRQGGGNLSTASLDVLLYRMAALAAAHRRLAGCDDGIDGNRGPVDHDFVMTLMRDAPPQIRLEWIGLLQYHKCAPTSMLIDAWRRVLPMTLNSDALTRERSRHWERFAKEWPEDAASLRKDFPR